MTGPAEWSVPWRIANPLVGFDIDRFARTVHVQHRKWVYFFRHRERGLLFGNQLHFDPLNSSKVMLEILFVVALCKKMGSMMRGRGYEKPFWFQFCLVLCWLGGEVFGALVCGILRVLTEQPEVTGFDFVPYLSALVGAGVGAATMFLIAGCFSRQAAEPPPLPSGPPPLPGFGSAY